MRFTRSTFLRAEGANLPQLAISLDGRGKLHRQVYRAVRASILERRVEPGVRLPSSRDLAGQAGVSRNTVLQAYEQLLAEGYAESRRGAGTFVVEPLPEREAPKRRAVSRERTPPLSSYARRALSGTAPWGASWELPRRGLRYDFRYGEPSFSDFPHELWARTVARRLRRASAAQLGYRSPGGAAALREALADYLRRSRGVACTAEQVVVVRGAQQGVDLAARVLCDAGELALLEEPHYPGFRWALGAAGVDLASVPVDEEGLCVDALAKTRGAKLCVVTPSHQYPTGVIMPLARRMRLLEWAERSGAWILEDDYDGEYRYDVAPIESLQGIDGGHRVIYAGTTSKVMFPSLRIGYLVLPKPLVPAFLAAQALTDTGSAGVEQLALADFIRAGHFERHLRRSRARHAERRAALLEAVERHLGDRVRVSGENAGLHLLLWLRGVSARRADEIRRRAAERGVGVYPATACFTRPPRRPAFLLGYSGLETSAIRTGIRRLARVMDAVSPA